MLKSRACLEEKRAREAVPRLRVCTLLKLGGGGNKQGKIRQPSTRTALDAGAWVIVGLSSKQPRPATRLSNRLAIGGVALFR
jgi:hypothetical protein